MIAAATALAASPLLGQIQFVGSVSPTGPGDGDVEDTLEIGVGTDPEDVDPRGSVFIEGGSTLQFDEVWVGSDEGFLGRLVVSGFGSLLEVEGAGSTLDPAFQVGREGDGYLLVDDGATLDLLDDSGDMIVGYEPTSVGRAIVDGPLTFVSIGQDLVIGNEGLAWMDISGGAVVRTRDTTSAGITIGAASGGVGYLTVDGFQTRLRSADDLTIGGLGAGTLSISNGAVVDADNSSGATASIGLEGRLELADGVLLVNGIGVAGVIEGYGLVRGVGSGTVAIASTGRVDANEAGRRLTFDDAVSNQGSIRVLGSELETLETFTNSAGTAALEPGRIEVRSGTVRFVEGASNAGVIAATEGASSIHGEVANQATGSVIVARDAVLTFHDDFTDNGGSIDVLAGGNVLFLGDATFAAASTLSLAFTDEDLGGAPLSVSGTAALAGELQLDLPEDFSPDLGETFTLLEAGAITGSFIPPLLPTLDGGRELGLVNTGTSLLLEVSIDTSGLPGDYNSDGVVNAADYTVWRDGLGTVFDQSDYDVWSANYGATASASQAVPEPTALAGLVAFSAAAVTRRPRRGMACQ
ncbi:hypothetical protein [Botrimarina sp.]|uniref:hypothetical protein n=1 Tax=Botrimarina sp. TaxID=2795802 RepID=UPI0032EB6A32